MGDVIDMGFDGKEKFRREVEVIVEDLINCLVDNFGEGPGLLMARSFSAALDHVSVEVTKRLEVRNKDEEFEVEFTPDFNID